MRYILTQLDGNDCQIQRTIFHCLPSLHEFDVHAYYIDIDLVEEVYEDLVLNIGQWIHVASGDEDGRSEFYLEEGVSFCLEKIEQEDEE